MKDQKQQIGGTYVERPELQEVYVNYIRFVGFEHGFVRFELCVDRQGPQHDREFVLRFPQVRMCMPAELAKLLAQQLVQLQDLVTDETSGGKTKQ